MKQQVPIKRTACATDSAAATATAGSVAPTTPRRLRRRDVVQLYRISGRTLTNWQRRHVIPYERVGRLVLFSPSDIEAALRRYRIAAVGERQ